MNHLSEVERLFVLVAAKDLFPAWTPGTLHVWSDEAEAERFMEERSLEGIEVGTIECDRLFELLVELRRVGCELLNVDGESFPVSAVIELLEGESDHALAVPALTAPNVLAHAGAAS